MGGVPCQPPRPRAAEGERGSARTSEGGRAQRAEPDPAARLTHHVPRRSGPAAGSEPGRSPSRAASRATGRQRSPCTGLSLAPGLWGARPRGSDPGPAPWRPRPPRPTPRSLGGARARALPRVRRSTGSGRRTLARPRCAATCSIHTRVACTHINSSVSLWAVRPWSLPCFYPLPPSPARSRAGSHQAGSSLGLLSLYPQRWESLKPSPREPQEV